MNCRIILSVRRRGRALLRLRYKALVTLENVLGRRVNGGVKVKTTRNRADEQESGGVGHLHSDVDAVPQLLLQTSVPAILIIDMGVILAGESVKRENLADWYLKKAAVCA